MDGFLASLIAAFGGGALSFLSPCVLPLVPGYLCFAAGLQFSDIAELESKGQARRAILPGALAFVAGFSTVFIALGAGAAAINPLLISHQQILGQVAGGFIILLGLHMTHIIQIPLLGREARLVRLPRLVGRERRLSFIVSVGTVPSAFAMRGANEAGISHCDMPVDS